MSLLLMIAVMVTVLIFIVFRDNLSALACSELNSRPYDKEKERGSIFMKSHDKNRKPREQMRKATHCKTRQGIVSNTWFPKHKTDPQIFVDDEEIGQEPVEN